MPSSSESTPTALERTDVSMFRTRVALDVEIKRVHNEMIASGMSRNFERARLLDARYELLLQRREDLRTMEELQARYDAMTASFEALVRARKWDEAEALNKDLVKTKEQMERERRAGRGANPVVITRRHRGLPVARAPQAPMEIPDSFDFHQKMTFLRMFQLWVLGDPRNGVPPLRNATTKDARTDHGQRSRRKLYDMKVLMKQVEVQARASGVWHNDNEWTIDRTVETYNEIKEHFLTDAQRKSEKRRKKFDSNSWESIVREFRRREAEKKKAAAMEPAE